MNDMIIEKTTAWEFDVPFYGGPPLTEVVERIKREGDDCTDRPTEIRIDAAGLGAAVVDRLRAMGLPVKGFYRR